MQEKYRDWFAQALPKAKEFGRQLTAGESPVFPTLHTEKWAQYCTETEAIRTCITACPDDDKKTKATAVMTAAHDIVCDTEIKAKAPCLQEVAKVPSEACNTQCASFKAPILAAYQDYKTTGTRDFEKAKVAGKNVCLFVNCRLKCRKNDIEAKCGADGYAAAKKLVKELAILGKTTHAQFRPAQNFPEECNPDSVVAGA